MNESTLSYSPGPELTDFGVFFDKLMSNYEDLQNKAKDKLEEERFSLGSALDLPSWVPGVGHDYSQGDADACGFAESKELLRSFATERLNGDYDTLENMKASLESARIVLNGKEPSAGESGAVEGVDSGITDMATGLASWKNATADTFREKYVTSIGPRKTRQYEAIGESKKAVQSASDILVETRRLALDLPLAAKKSLDEYNPSWNTVKGTAYATFIVIGIVAGPVGSTLSVVATESIDVSELSVATLMEAFRKAVITCRDNKSKGEKDVAVLLNGFAERRSGDWSGHVCARPAP